MLIPPSTGIAAPVMNRLSSEARNSTASAISSGVAWRPSGIIDSKISAARASLLARGRGLDPVLEAVVDRARVDRVDADAAVGDLLGGGPHEPDQRVLRRRVGGDAGVGGEADDARVEDQAPARAHRAQRVLGDVERAEHVDRQHAREDLLVVLLHRRDVAEDPGVGERDVELARHAHGAATAANR